MAEAKIAEIDPKTKKQENLKIFREKTGRIDDAPRDFVIALQNSDKDSIGSQILEDDITRGILLGYGRKSATIYKRMSELTPFLWV